MKNPFLSMWLSAANTAAGSARAFWTVEMQRQQKAFAKGLAAGLEKAVSREAEKSQLEIDLRVASPSPADGARVPHS